MTTRPLRRYAYCTDGPEIYRESFAIVRAETDLSGIPDDARHLAVRMVHAGGLPAGNEVICHLRDHRVEQLAAAWGTTRSAAAVSLWGDELEGAVVAIGNAPTALFHLLEWICEGGPRPAAIIGVPVGFVGSAE